MEQPKTIRELVEQKSLLLRHPEQLTPEQASRELVELSSLKSSINREASERLYWLNVKRQELRKEHKSAAAARIEADASKEWQSWKEADDFRDAVIEMERSLKYFLRNMEQERKETRY